MEVLPVLDWIRSNARGYSCRHGLVLLGRAFRVLRPTSFFERPPRGRLEDNRHFHGKTTRAHVKRHGGIVFLKNRARRLSQDTTTPPHTCVTRPVVVHLRAPSCGTDGEENVFFFFQFPLQPERCKMATQLDIASGVVELRAAAATQCRGD